VLANELKSVPLRTTRERKLRLVVFSKGTLFMKRFIFKGLAIAGIFAAAIGLSPSAIAQSAFMVPGPSFSPAGGIPGAVANQAAWTQRRVSIVNGVPVNAGAAAYAPMVVRPNVLPNAVPLNFGGAVPNLAGQAHCKGFARASDGSLVATSGGGFQSMIVGAECDQLIQQTLEAGHGVIFSASVLFTGSSDIITLSAKRALEMTADAITASGGIYEVSGYASREGDRIANDYLSWRRAKAASYYLIRHGVGAPSLNVVGKGETTIFGPELAVNRRVVVRRKV